MTPAEIAKGLSGVHRDAILKTKTDGDGEYWFMPGTARGVPMELKERGLDLMWLTPIGLEVRAILEGQRA
jgi:hypothetical protein